MIKESSKVIKEHCLALCSALPWIESSWLQIDQCSILLSGKVSGICNGDFHLCHEFVLHYWFKTLSWMTLISLNYMMQDMLLVLLKGELQWRFLIPQRPVKQKSMSFSSAPSSIVQFWFCSSPSFSFTFIWLSCLWVRWSRK